MSDSKPVIIYHKNCDDGFGAAYSAWTLLKDKAIYQPMGYRDELDKSLIKGRDVIIVDFSFSPEVMYSDILPVCKSARILDHHKSAKEDWENSQKYKHLRRGSSHVLSEASLYKYSEGNLTVEFDLSKSGAKLSWEYFHPGIAVPQMIEHISDGDLWKFEIAGTKELQMYLRARPMNFTSWDNIFQDMSRQRDQTRIYDYGSKILDFYMVQVRGEASSRKVKPITFSYVGEDGSQVSSTGLIANASQIFASDLGNQLAQKSGTFGVIWETDGKTAFCSIRSVKGFNCIPIAKQFGGGGHPAACGFSLPLSNLSSYF